MTKSEDKKPPKPRRHLPLSERIFVTPSQGRQMISVGKTKFFELLKSGEIDSVAVGKRRLVSVQSLMRLGRTG
jgi:hypothetical protein